MTLSLLLITLLLVDTYCRWYWPLFIIYDIIKVITLLPLLLRVTSHWFITRRRLHIIIIIDTHFASLSLTLTCHYYCYCLLPLLLEIREYASLLLLLSLHYVITGASFDYITLVVIGCYERYAIDITYYASHLLPRYWQSHYCWSLALAAITPLLLSPLLHIRHYCYCLIRHIRLRHYYHIITLSQ